MARDEADTTFAAIKSTRNFAVRVNGKRLHTLAIVPLQSISLHFRSAATLGSPGSRPLILSSKRAMPCRKVNSVPSTARSCGPRGVLAHALTITHSRSRLRFCRPCTQASGALSAERFVRGRPGRGELLIRHAWGISREVFQSTSRISRQKQP